MHCLRAPATGTLSLRPLAAGTSIRISMTAVTSGGSFSGGGTGANLDIPLGTFSSLLSLFNSTVTVYSSQQAGQPAQWWATGNTYVAYSLPLALSVSLWYSAVPGSPAYEPNCNLQGVNVCEWLAAPEYYLGLVVLAHTFFVRCPRGAHFYRFRGKPSHP